MTDKTRLLLAAGVVALLAGATTLVLHGNGDGTKDSAPDGRSTPTMLDTTIPNDLPMPLSVSSQFQVDSNPASREAVFSTEVTNNSNRSIAVDAFKLTVADTRVSLISVSPSRVSLAPGKAARLAFHFKVASCEGDSEYQTVPVELTYSTQGGKGQGKLELPGIRRADWRKITIDSVCKAGGIVGGR